MRTYLNINNTHKCTKSFTSTNTTWNFFITFHTINNQEMTILQHFFPHRNTLKFCPQNAHTIETVKWDGIFHIIMFGMARARTDSKCPGMNDNEADIGLVGHRHCRGVGIPHHFAIQRRGRPGRTWTNAEVDEIHIAAYTENTWLFSGRSRSDVMMRCINTDLGYVRVLWNSEQLFRAVVGVAETRMESTRRS